MSILVKWKQLVPEAVEPYQGTEDAAAYDMTATSYEYDIEHDCVVYHTGIAMEIPQGYAGFLYPRSSVCNKDLILTNCVGIIDSDYRGEVLFKFAKRANRPGGDRYYREGERIGQLIVRKVEKIQFWKVDELSKTKRGTGGYGSTGR